MKVLIVDDSDFVLNILERTLWPMGFEVVRARDGAEALAVLRQGEIHLVITDWEMPGMTGLELCRIIRKEDLNGYVYLIMLTGREGATCRREGLTAGADDFLNKPLNLDELAICLNRAERILSLETRDLALFALAKLAESRDPETGGHLERVQLYTRLLATNLTDEAKLVNCVDDEYVRLLYQTSPLHDLGKVGVPDAILLKRGKLTPEEFSVMKTHATLGGQTLDAALAKFPNAKFLRMARDIALTHHEKYDGSGYPLGLKGGQIPFCGRIVALADVYDALTSRRVYKESQTHAMARDAIVKQRGAHFDPEVVDAFLRAEEEFLKVLSQPRTETAANEQSQKREQHELAAANADDPYGCKILAVEDSTTILKWLSDVLRTTSYPVLSASNVSEAIKLFDEHKPGVVVSDWEMPGASGVDLCAAIRERAGDRPVHFIMLTQRSDSKSLLEAFNSGIDDFVSKPCSAEELLARVRAGLRAWRLNEELSRKTLGLQRLNSRLAEANDRLDKMAVTDELTGLYNRRQAMARMEEGWSAAERYSNPLSVAMLDIDHFKHINDTYGHAAGDLVLREVARIIRDRTRVSDTVCRVGGEEFLIIFSQQTAREAAACAQRCRLAVQKYAFQAAGQSIAVTISGGVAEKSGATANATDLMRAADDALYAAKHGGRNRISAGEDKQTEEKPMTTSGDEPSNSVQMTPDYTPQINIEELVHRCGDDAEFAVSVIERFREDSPGELEHIAQAATSGDADDLRRAAHNLKSMAAYVTADAVADLARQIESLARENHPEAAAPILARLRDEVERLRVWLSHGENLKLAKCA